MDGQCLGGDRGKTHPEKREMQTQNLAIADADV